jgi:DNA-binding transcriptional ArsR family regulator
MARQASDSSAFAAVADPTRRAILDALARGGEQTVNDLRKALGKLASRISQPAFSQHLAVLRNAELVHAEPRGRHRVYTLRAKPLKDVNDWVATYSKFWDERLDALGTYLDAKHVPGARAMSAASSGERGGGAGGGGSSGS